MKNRIYLLIIGLVLLSFLASAETYDVGLPIDLQFTCTLNGAIPSTSATYNISIYNPNGNAVIDNQQTSAKNNGRFNYTYTFLTTGRYTIQQNCIDGSNSYSSHEEVDIIGIGHSEDKGISDTTIFLVIAFLFSLFIYAKVHKFFGSMMIFIIGFGVLFQISSNGWIGWTIIGGGFILIINSLLAKPKKLRRQF